MLYSRSSSGSKAGGGVIAGGIAVLVVTAIILGLLGFFTLTTTVAAGQECLKVRNGGVEEQMERGRSGINRIVEDKRCFNTRLQLVEVVAGNPDDYDSNADYEDWPIDGKTNQGIDFSTTLSVQYHVDPTQVVRIYETVARSDAEVYERVVKKNVREQVPQILNQYTADQLYFGELVSISDRIQQELTPLLDMECPGLLDGLGSAAQPGEQHVAHLLARLLDHGAAQLRAA